MNVYKIDFVVHDTHTGEELWGDSALAINSEIAIRRLHSAFADYINRELRGCSREDKKFLQLELKKIQQQPSWDAYQDFAHALDAQECLDGQYEHEIHLGKVEVLTQ